MRTAAAPPPIAVAAPAGIAGPVVAAAAALIAAWIASGSTGVLGHPLRHALADAAVVVAVLAAWSGRESTWREKLIAAVGLAAAAWMLASPLMAINVLGVALATAAVTLVARPAGRAMLVAAAMAALALGVYRIAYTGVPWFFLLADRIGSALGWLGGAVVGRPLNTGATFGGVELLLPMIVLLAGIAASSRAPRRNLILWGIAGIVAAHLLYMIALALIPEWMGPPPPPKPRSFNPADKPDLALVERLRPLVPWNLPAIGVMLQATVAVLLLRFAPWTPATAVNAHGGPVRSRPLLRPLIVAGAAALALAAAACPWWSAPDLAGKKIVVYKHGFLNWLKPKHGEYGRLSIGMYGMMSEYFASLGAQCLISEDLSPTDIADAHAIILMFPNREWTPVQKQRLAAYVQEGGTLCVFGEHTIHEPATPNAPVAGDRGSSRFNEVLANTSMYVRFDSATFQIGGWLQSYEQMLHSTTAGLRDDRNQIGSVIGASVAAKFPAQPFIIGRWGWNDPGDPGAGAAMMGNHNYDAGERLGDVILAAEQRVGRGRVVVFGDTSAMTNGITPGSYVFTSRLLGYLASRGQAHPALAQIIAALGAIVLLAACWRGRSEWTIGAAAIVLGFGVNAASSITHARWTTLPDGRRAGPTNNLAYIAASNLEAYSQESWRPEGDGLGALHMTLVRNGYLCLNLGKMTEDALERAGLVFAAAAQRPYTRAERQAIARFVEGGGIFITSVGADCAEGSRELLGDFGLWVGKAPDDPGEPEPLGHFKSPYFQHQGENYMAFVRFHAGWVIGPEPKGDDLSLRVLAYGRANKPIILLQKRGKGKFVLIGDTMFATNRNLENEDGSPFEGMRENADFWRWFISYLQNPDKAWYPPNPRPPAATQPGVAPGPLGPVQPPPEEPPPDPAAPAAPAGGEVQP